MLLTFRKGTMNRKEYAEACKRTSRGLNSTAERLSNFALGLVGECAEVNELINNPPFQRNLPGQAHKLIEHCTERQDKLCKEFGDVFWYMFRMLSVFGDDYDSFLADCGGPMGPTIEYTEFYCSETKSVKIGDLGLKLFRLAGRIADDIKKHVFQGKELNTMLPDLLGYMYLICEYILSCYGMTVEYVFEKNVEKLSKRYPNGFTTEDAAKKRDENLV